MTPQGFGLKRALLEGGHHRKEVLFQVGLKHLETHPVDAGSAAVAPDRLEGLAHQDPGNPAG
jgi:hypothetical protein